MAGVSQDVPAGNGEAVSAGRGLRGCASRGASKN